MNFILISLLCLAPALVHARSVQDDDKCSEAECKLPNCRCSSTTSPLSEGTAPQLIALTIDEAVVNLTHSNIWAPLLSGRTNPDGNKIGVTFFVPHEYTDYTVVQKLYVEGYEIGVNSISRNSSEHYWDVADKKLLVDEFGGDRLLISHFAKIPIEDIRGARTPQFRLNGDVSIDAYHESGIHYDNSWPTPSTSLLYAYTLDFASTQRKYAFMKPPKESHPGFWIAPITNIVGIDGVECNNLITCNVSGTANDISTWLLSEVERVRSTSKAPISLVITSGWFDFLENSYDGFEQFLDKLVELDDVFLVSQSQIIDWVKNPVPVENFKTATFDRQADCNNSVNCALVNLEGELRYMRTCVACPKDYPWVGNPLGDDSDPTIPTDSPTPTTSESTTKSTAETTTMSKDDSTTTEAI